MPTPSLAETENPTLADLVADAKQVQLSLLPRPRSETSRRPGGQDTPAEIRIPESTIALLDGFEPYGA